LIAAAVATVPPVVLLAATHMTVILTRPDEPAIEPEPVLPPAAVQPVPESPPATEPPSAPPTTRKPPVQPALVGPEAVGDGERTWLMEKARRMRADGWSVAEIAEDLGRSVGTIRRWLKTTETTETSGDDDE
jgi:hypothetical protein